MTKGKLSLLNVHLGISPAEPVLSQLLGTALDWESCMLQGVHCQLPDHIDDVKQFTDAMVMVHVMLCFHPGTPCQAVRMMRLGSRFAPQQFDLMLT